VGTQGQNTINIILASAMPPVDQGEDNKKKGIAEDMYSKYILANIANPKKKVKINTNLSPK
jgi:hypothetical protein